MSTAIIKIINEYLVRLFPICRSLTGAGNRETIRILSDLINLNVYEVPSGKQVFDWIVPEEWNIRDAWIKDSNGHKIVDFKENNIHVVGYSAPIHSVLKFSELRTHLHTLPAHPHLTPYRTSYYKRDWGFCMAHEKLERLDPAEPYEVFIDSSLDPRGSLTIADCVHTGSTDQEILLSTYCCHPSLANDNLSGLILAVLLYKYISSRPTRYTYRLVVVPETIGAIAYLDKLQTQIRKVIGGAVITTVGGPGKLGMKCSFDRNSLVERAARSALSSNRNDWIEFPFVPDGSDERQYSSPAFRIPTITICKDKYYEYLEYHTSADNLSFVLPENIYESYLVYLRWIEILENNQIFVRTNPSCEFQLGRRGLFPNIGGSINQTALRPSDESTEIRDYSIDGNQKISGKDLEAISWLMFGCDGKMDLLAIAEQSGIDFATLHKVAVILKQQHLLV